MPRKRREEPRFPFPSFLEEGPKTAEEVKQRVEFGIEGTDSNGKTFSYRGPHPAEYEPFMMWREEKVREARDSGLQSKRLPRPYVHFLQWQDEGRPGCAPDIHDRLNRMYERMKCVTGMAYLNPKKSKPRKQKKPAQAEPAQAEPEEEPVESQAEPEEEPVESREEPEKEIGEYQEEPDEEPVVSQEEPQEQQEEEPRPVVSPEHDEPFTLPTSTGPFAAPKVVPVALPLPIAPAAGPIVLGPEREDDRIPEFLLRLMRDPMAYIPDATMEDVRAVALEFMTSLIDGDTLLPETMKIMPFLKKIERLNAMDLFRKAVDLFFKVHCHPKATKDVHVKSKLQRIVTWSMVAYARECSGAEIPVELTYVSLVEACKVYEVRFTDLGSQLTALKEILEALPDGDEKTRRMVLVHRFWMKLRIFIDGHLRVGTWNHHHDMFCVPLFGEELGIDPTEASVTPSNCLARIRNLMRECTDDVVLRMLQYCETVTTMWCSIFEAYDERQSIPDLTSWTPDIVKYHLRCISELTKAHSPLGKARVIPQSNPLTFINEFVANTVPRFYKRDGFKTTEERIDFKAAYLHALSVKKLLEPKVYVPSITSDPSFVVGTHAAAPKKKRKSKK
jgi:hypothetical protein